MEKICNMQQYKTLISQNKEKHQHVSTNCFTMGNFMQELIDSDRLYYQEYASGLVIFVDEERYYNIYYYLDLDSEFPDLRQDKPVLIEELNNNSRRDAQIENLSRKISQKGFRFLKNNLQLEMDLTAHIDNLREEFDKRLLRLESGLKLDYATDTEQIKKAVELWESALDPTDIPLDHMKTSLEENEKIICVFDEAGEVCATNWWINTSKSSEGRHTVTHPNHYRKGLASLVLLAWYIDAYDSGAVKAIGWADETNVKSIAMQQKLGCELNNRNCTQFILD